MCRLRQVVLCLAAVCLTLRTDACMETARANGILSQNYIVDAFTLSTKGGGECRCCAFCHKNKDCASFSFGTATGACQLYNTVASYDTLTLDDSWRYFVMPGRSEHHQFCRTDSDCLAKGDFCRGRVCTNFTTVTCRAILETITHPGQFVQHPLVYGWVDGQEVMLKCYAHNDGRGFTRLLRISQGDIVTRDNITRFNDVPAVFTSHSILYLAEHIRRSGTGPSYQVLFRDGSNFYAEFPRVPRETPFLSSTPRKDPWAEVQKKGSDPALKTFSLPFNVTTKGENIILVTAEEEDGTIGVRSVARTDGRFWHGLLNKLNIYIRE